MGSDAVNFELSNTSEESIRLRKKYLGYLADKDVELIVENVGEGIDEVAWMNYDRPSDECPESKSGHQVQTTAYGEHSSYSNPPIRGPFTCIFCYQTVEIK